MGYELSGITLMLILGLRHGLDPDHIAVIDNLTMHHHGIKSSFGKWSGSLFAIGHGIVITIVSVIFSFVENSVFTNCGLLSVLEWVPILLLYLVGFINLKSLLSKTSDYKLQGWRFRFIPKKLLGSKSALSIVLSGVLFALVFDTVTQAADKFQYSGKTSGHQITVTLKESGKNIRISDKALKCKKQDLLRTLNMFYQKYK